MLLLLHTLSYGHAQSPLKIFIPETACWRPLSELTSEEHQGVYQYSDFNVYVLDTSTNYLFLIKSSLHTFIEDSLNICIEGNLVYRASTKYSKRSMADNRTRFKYQGDLFKPLETKISHRIRMRGNTLWVDDRIYKETFTVRNYSKHNLYRTLHPELPRHN